MLNFLTLKSTHKEKLPLIPNQSIDDNVPFAPTINDFIDSPPTYPDLYIDNLKTPLFNSNNLDSHSSNILNYNLYNQINNQIDNKYDNQIDNQIDNKYVNTLSKKELDNQLRALYELSHKTNNYLLWKNTMIQIIDSNIDFKFSKFDYEFIRKNFDVILNRQLPDALDIIEQNNEIDELKKIRRKLFNKNILITISDKIYTLFNHPRIFVFEGLFRIKKFPSFNKINTLFINHQENSIKYFNMFYTFPKDTDNNFLLKKNFFNSFDKINHAQSIITILNDLKLNDFEIAFGILSFLIKFNLFNISDKFDSLLDLIPINYLHSPSAKYIDNVLNSTNSLSSDMELNNKDSEQVSFAQILFDEYKLDKLKKLILDPSLDINFFSEYQSPLVYNFLIYRNKELFNLILTRNDLFISYDNNALLKEAINLNDKSAIESIIKHPNFISNSRNKHYKSLI